MSKLKKNEIDQEIIRIKVEIETLELQRNNVSISGAYYELATKAIITLLEMTVLLKYIRWNNEKLKKFVIFFTILN